MKRQPRRVVGGRTATTKRQPRRLEMVTEQQHPPRRYWRCTNIITQNLTIISTIMIIDLLSGGFQRSASMIRMTKYKNQEFMIVGNNINNESLPHEVENESASEFRLQQDSIEVMPKYPPRNDTSSNSTQPDTTQQLDTTPKVTNQIARKCVPSKTITTISEAVKDLNEHHKIRIFPRNGFLLGVIRHEGFLPTEKIDADLGLIFTDIDHMDVKKTNRVGDFVFVPKPTERAWVNWKGRSPITNERYPFFQVPIKRPPFSQKATMFYPYHNNTYFYPWCTMMRSNHRGRVKEMLRYNMEGANDRLVDTNELVNKTNFKNGKQIGTVFSSDFSCTVEKKFYFTTILVPCDYEAILDAFYGKNWRRVEQRTDHESLVLSDEENESFLKDGPLPLCSA